MHNDGHFENIFITELADGKVIAKLADFGIAEKISVSKLRRPTSLDEYYLKQLRNIS